MWERCQGRQVRREGEGEDVRGPVLAVSLLLGRLGSGRSSCRRRARSGRTPRCCCGRTFRRRRRCRAVVGRGRRRRLFSWRRRGGVALRLRRLLLVAVVAPLLLLRIRLLRTTEAASVPSPWWATHAHGARRHSVRRPMAGIVRGERLLKLGPDDEQEILAEQLSLVNHGLIRPANHCRDVRGVRRSKRARRTKSCQQSEQKQAFRT